MMVDELGLLRAAKARSEELTAAKAKLQVLESLLAVAEEMKVPYVTLTALRAVLSDPTVAQEEAE